MTYSETRAFTAIALNVLLWSVFPVIAFFAQASQALLHIVFFSQLFGLLISVPFVGTKLNARRTIARFKDNFGAYVLLAVASILLQLLFLTAFAETSGYIATIALEAWPLFAFFFVAKFVKRSWEDLTPANIAILFGCGFGLALTVSPEITSSAETDQDQYLWLTIFAVFVAIAASIASAATTLQANLAQPREESELVSLVESARVVLVLRLVSTVFLGLLCLIFERGPIDMQSVTLGAAFGITSFGIASILAVYGVRNSQSAKSVLLWFLAPPLALYWLSLVSDEALETNTLLGLVVLLTCNVFLNFIEMRTRAVLVSTASIFFSLAYLTNFDGQSARYFFESIAVLTTFYVIFVGFTVSRQQEVSSLEMQIAIDEVKSASVEELESTASDFEDILATSLKALRVQKVRSAAFLKILTIRSRNSSRPELIVSSVLAAAIVVICLVFRPNGHLENIASIALIFSITFSLVHVFEVSSPKRSWQTIAGYLRAEGDRQAHKKGVFEAAYFSHILYLRPHSIYLFFVVYALILGISYYVLR